MSAADKVRFVVDESDRGLRLDKLLAARVEGLSRRRARVLLDIGGVFVDRARIKVAGRVLRPGQVVEVHLGGALERATKGVGRAARDRDAHALPDYRVVFEDEHLVVVDKPAGLLAAPTPESDRGNLADLLARRGGGEPGAILVVHRIDLPTSGLLVYAKTPDANRALAERFRVHDVERVYLAVLDGVLAEDEHTVRAPVGGRDAISHLAVERRLDGATLARVRLETGRTHQIRIHAADLGHPVLGDRQYGRRTDRDPPRLALHAARLGFAHPVGGEPFTFDSPWPDDLGPWLSSLEGPSR